MSITESNRNFDWEDFLLFSKFIKSENYFKNQISQTEAVVRTVIGRCYYSSFQKTCLHLEKRKLYNYDSKIDKKSSHEKILSILNNISYLTKENSYDEIAFLLNNMKKKRKNSDYKIISLNNQIATSNDCIRNAERVISLIKTLDTKYSVIY